VFSTPEQEEFQRQKNQKEKEWKRKVSYFGEPKVKVGCHWSYDLCPCKFYRSSMPKLILKCQIPNHCFISRLQSVKLLDWQEGFGRYTIIKTGKKHMASQSLVHGIIEMANQKWTH
jgi:hypothetical protein